MIPIITSVTENVQADDYILDYARESYDLWKHISRAVKLIIVVATLV